MKYVIGIDDHDSPNRGCTTHFATNLIKILYKNGIKLLDFPYLIRLNPNIPWKTRGNAAIKLIVESDKGREEIADIIWNASLDYVNNVSQGLKYGRKPGMAIVNYD
ncbi:MAG: tRNA(Ile2) 2-agmatinylcytidine synthetase TiaS, partial [Acidianus infernus]|nr:tRNA(Ile2) 2-agmatinylcytidine synthetase TiaS [Acidianus infernus]